ncbi:MAG: hypothetical protein WC462_00065 [archaeon]
MSEFDKRAIALSFRKFKDYSTDVLGSNSATFDTRLKIFIDHCENDPIMAVISSQLKKIESGFDTWWEKALQSRGSFIGSATFDLPTDENLRDSLLYDICSRLNSRQIRLDSFSLAFFTSTRFDDMVSDFNDSIFRPLTRSLEYKFDTIDFKIEDEYSQTNKIPETVLIVYTDNRVLIKDSTFEGDAVVGKSATLDK